MESKKQSTTRDFGRVGINQARIQRGTRADWTPWGTCWIALGQCIHGVGSAFADNALPPMSLRASNVLDSVSYIEYRQGIDRV